MFETEQEKFWHGEFGDEYIERNRSAYLISSNIALFAKIIQSTHDVKTVVEFGSNIGLNLKALDRLLPDLKCTAIEINAKAVEILRNDNGFQHPVNVFEQSILDYQSTEEYDFSLIKGVLIYINPDKLNKVYESLYNSSRKYICIAEYYNPSPITVSYHNNTEKLFKRDFAGEFMDKYSDVQLVDYGFVYHRDNNFSQDDITWFLLEKKS